MSLTRTIKVGDLGQPLRAKFIDDATDLPVDFTAALNVVLKAYDASGVLKINAPARVESPLTGGILAYDWLSGDTAVAGELRAVFKVDWGAASPESFPSKGHFVIDVQEDFGG